MTGIQKLKGKNQNDKLKCKNVVRGFSLVPGWYCTTLKSRTTTVFGLIIQKSKVKKKNDNSKGKNVVRGFSLVQHD